MTELYLTTELRSNFVGFDYKRLNVALNGQEDFFLFFVLFFLLFLSCLDRLLFLHVLLKRCLFASLFVVSKFQLTLFLFELLLQPLQIDLLLNFFLFSLAYLLLDFFLISAILQLDLHLFPFKLLAFLLDPLSLSFLFPHELRLLALHLLLVLFHILLHFLLLLLLNLFILGPLAIFYFLEGLVPVDGPCISC